MYFLKNSWKLLISTEIRLYRYGKGFKLLEMGQSTQKWLGPCWVLLGPAGSCWVLAGYWWVLLGPAGSLLGTGGSLLGTGGYYFK